jgi:hypothetical protein
MKIKAKNQNVHSMELIVPVDGRISIDANGVAEVSAKCAAALVKGTNDWDYAKKATAVQDDEEEEDDNEGEATDRDKFAAHLDTLTLAQMKDLAKEGEMPEEEYEKLNSKKLMKAYLLKKYDEAAEAGELDEEDDEEEEDDNEGGEQ